MLFDELFFIWFLALLWSSGGTGKPVPYGFSCMSVIGSAAKTLVKDTMQYDSVDDAALLPEQVVLIAPTFVFLYWRTKNMEVKLYETIN